MISNRRCGRHFGSDIVIPLGYFLVFGIDAEYLVKETVGLQGRSTFSRSSVALDVPQVGMNVAFATELGYRIVNGDTTHCQVICCYAKHCRSMVKKQSANYLPVSFHRSAFAGGNP